MASSTSNWKPAKFEWLYHGALSHSARSIRQNGLKRGSYVTTNPHVAMLEAVGRSTGYHPVMSGVLDFGDIQAGLVTPRRMVKAARYAADKKKWGGMQAKYGGHPVVFKIKRTGLKGFDSDPEYWGGDDYNGPEYPVGRRFAFISKNPIPASHIAGAVNFKKLK